MALKFYEVPAQVDAFDPATDHVLVTDNASFNGSGRRPVSSIFQADVVTDATATITLSDVTHGGRVLRTTSGSAVTITVPNSLKVGFNVTVIQSGAGQITFVAGSGATLYNADTQFKSALIHAMVTVVVEANAGGTAAVAVLAGRTAT